MKEKKERKKKRKWRQKSELSLSAAGKLLGRTSEPQRAPERLTTVAAELSMVLNPPLTRPGLVRTMESSAARSLNNMAATSAVTAAHDLLKGLFLIRFYVICTKDFSLCTQKYI